MPRTTKPLTDAAIRNAKPKAKRYKLYDGGGLFLEVLPTGGKSWRMKYHVEGHVEGVGKRVEKSLGFGMYPAVGIADARRQHEEAKVLLAQGIDPDLKRKQDKAEASARAVEIATTLEVVARDWHARQSRRWKEGTAATIMLRLSKHIFPRLGSTPIAALTAPTLLELLREIEGREKFETAKRIRQYLDGIYAFAIACGLAENNPAAAIAKAMTPHRAEHRAAMVKTPDATRLFRAIWSHEGRPETVVALKLLALTACRPGEIQKAAWSEINLKAHGGPLWVIPANKAKMKREHCVPLSPQAVEIIENIRPLTGASPYLFPHMTDPTRHMCDAVLLNALRRLGFSKEETTAHGLRSTFSTLARESAWPHHVVESALAHNQGNSVSQAYDRAQYLPERRKMLEWWADFIDGLVSGAKVTPIHAQAAS